MERLQRIALGEARARAEAERRLDVAFFVKRAGHRTERAKAEKDLTDARNYLAMMRQHVEDAQLKLGPGLSEQG